MSAIDQQLEPPTSSVIDIKSILTPIQADMRKLDEVIEQSLRSDVALINQISQYLIQAGGKRIRPALTFLIAGAIREPSEVQHRHEIAAVVEFIHTATLLHDDVVDDSDLRRGRKTANAVFGNSASVLVGDFLYSRAFQMMVVPGQLKIMEILSTATNIIAEGEVLQLLNLNDPDVTEDRYRQVIMYKTAKLFEAATQLGAVLAKGTEGQYAAAAQFGSSLGIAFQIMDDWLDYASDAETMGKNAGDDLREGKPTLPLIYLLHHGNAQQKKLVQQAIEQSDELSEDFYQTVLNEVRNSSALAYTLEQAKMEAEKAKSCLSAFEDNAFTASLRALCDYSIARSF
ncbi:polyprenyl synthetase family protein [Polynucleobacter kasalickyi]|uniref:Octaprenyl diphosphate synthase n=1 Tax=Polynucleobacter kasalickyi TaxID=1938817 RepID=A0A1W2ACZ8_9BURK|nr:polyprenyl synthetase family protein [Polynucleobacter kasalickyi]SMC58331.1 octaprenyl-diphosphate synthase [Polynucleobacter kasalickyi]